MKIPEDVLEQHREINVQHEWWDYIYDLFKDDMSNIGIDVDEIYFRGFWSQGDGACFEGSIDDWAKFLPTIGYTNPTLLELACGSWSWKTEQRGHYSHSGSVHHDVDMGNPYHCGNDEYFINFYSPYLEENNLRSMAWLAVLKTFDYDLIERDIKDALADHMDDLYSRLESEYEDLTSDEAVAESIIANDLYREDECEQDS